MRITESQLRRVIRDVISESNSAVDYNTMRYNTLQLVQNALVERLVKSPAGKQFLKELCNLAEMRDEHACKEMLHVPRCDENRYKAIIEICSNPEMVAMGLPVPSNKYGEVN